MTTKGDLVRFQQRLRPTLWMRAKRLLALAVGTQSRAFVSPRFGPENWVAIWAALVLMNGDHQDAPEQSEKIDATLVRPIEEALTASGYGNLLGRAGEDMGLADQIAELQRFRDRYSR